MKQICLWLSWIECNYEVDVFLFLDQETLVGEIDQLRSGLKPKVAQLHKMEGTNFINELHTSPKGTVGQVGRPREEI